MTDIKVRWVCDKKKPTMEIEMPVPRVWIAVSGGVVTGVQASIPMDVHVHDEDELEETLDGEKRDALWEKRTKGLQPVY